MARWRIPYLQKLPWIGLFLTLLFLLKIWLNTGYESFYFDSDLARDLKELSHISQGKIVWLGPWLAPGLHASSSYYYLLYPAVVLGGGKVAAVVTFNVTIGLAALALFGGLATYRYRWGGVVGTLFLGLLPVITDNILHPGNGFTYLYFILISLTLMWFAAPLLTASGAAGLAIALHPAAGFLPLVLFYEWWRRGHQWLTAVVSSITVLIPLAPLVAFEIITKGYIIRNWLSKPSTNNITVGLSSHNFFQIADLLGTPWWILLLIVVISVFLLWRQSGRRLKIWFTMALAFLLITLFFQNILWRYLFGIALFLIFVITITFIRHRLTNLLLLLLCVPLLLTSPLISPPPPAARPIARVEGIADHIATLLSDDRTTTLGVIAAVTPATEVPQADDYRYLLRQRDFPVVDVTEHAQAEKLVMVIEVPNFDWTTWSNWEIESFGPKEIDRVENFNGVTLVMWKRAK